MVRIAGAARQGDHGGPDLAEASQYEAMRDFYVAGASTRIAVVRPAVGRRLKTATRANRAETGKLFGYGHIEPERGRAGSIARQRFAATIEADAGIVDDDWNALVVTFNGAMLQLGRSRRVEYGGLFACECKQLTPADRDLWPDQAGTRRDGALVLWALSDLAVFDRRTALPKLTPSLADLFPGEPDAALNMQRSAIAQRRYAPWNGKLRCRDVERAVIGAGSVLWFENVGATLANLSNVVGQYTETGLGHLWINPPILAGEQPQPWNTPSLVPQAEQSERADDISASLSPTDSARTQQLLLWMNERLADRDPTAREMWLNHWSKAITSLYKSARQFDGSPSRSQWNAVGEAVRAAKGGPALTATLFEGRSPVCGKPDQATKSAAWLANGRLDNATISFRDWLKGEIARGSDTTRDGLPWPQLKLALYGLVKAAGDLAKDPGISG